MIALMGGAIKAAVSPTSVSGSRVGAGICTSSAATLSGSGASGNNDFAWTAPGFTADSPTSAISTFSKSLSAGDTFNGTATGKVTDRARGMSDTVSLPVTLSASNPPPGPNFNITPSPIAMSRVGPGTVSTAVSVIIISGTGGPYSAVFTPSGGLSVTPTGPLDCNVSITLGANDSEGGVLFAQVTDANNGGVSNGATSWSATST